ncbi:HTTM domain-containing protein [Sungkyunkwania multivorans]|uniref:HTTM domain-containing protein n=1 Tax=Sungkyunkwania multivorans TaxID=1173618 RepID=A0ABW3CVQ2_9FLAO
MTLDKLLFKQIDNSPLIVFRIVFGLLIFLESVGAIFTGWVKRTLIDPEFTFSFIGFEWLQPLPGYGMYFYYLVMGVFGLFVMVGYRYRLSIAVFTIMWTATYLMQKASYNNHYYLLILLCAIMCILPAHRSLSLDVKRNPNLKSIAMPQWVKVIIILQLFIVYTYASVAKLYPDWLDHTVAENLMATRRGYPIIGELLQEHFIHVIITYFGIFFDLLIIPALLWKPTRKVAFIVSIFFHLFNSIVFQIGIFPYLSLAFTVFFFETKTIHELFLSKRKTYYVGEEIETPKVYKPFIALGALYFLIQIGLPLRHWAIKDDVLWTEEGHRMSWRMMLRSKYGRIRFKVVNKNTKTVSIIDPGEYLSKKQRRMVATKPDVIWQFAQYLERQYADLGQQVKVYAYESALSVNGRKLSPFIDPEIDLASEEWNHFSHHHWILPSPKE